ncbi:MAG: hypothetical protein HY529_00120, partial [Chloroflexi bacterium]|nr:hypothetical protein [Chloroflexota bacterium]
VEGRNWNIGGLLLKNVNSSIERPAAGNSIEIRGIVLGSEVYISQLKIKQKNDSNQVEIEGVFNGTSKDGSLWFVSSIPISIPSGTRPPSPGNEIELIGIMQGGSLILSEFEDEGYSTEEAEIRGILLAVDIKQKSIVMEVPPARIQTNVSQAEIRTRDGHKVDLTGLLSFLGEDIKTEGTYSKEGVLSASEVIVQVGRDKKWRDEKSEENTEKKESNTSQRGDERDRDSEWEKEDDSDSDVDWDSKRQIEKEESDTITVEGSEHQTGEKESDGEDDREHEEENDDFGHS